MKRKVLALLGFGTGVFAGSVVFRRSFQGASAAGRVPGDQHGTRISTQPLSQLPGAEHGGLRADLQVTTPGLKSIDPGDDLVLVPADRVDLEMASPFVSSLTHE